MRTLPVCLLLPIFLLACEPDKDGDTAATSDTGTPALVDLDGDGHLSDVDCDDNDPSINPGADELCNGLDDDCDGETDEADAIDAARWYADADEDGFGDPHGETSACEQPSGHLDDASDCDDTNPAINPDAEERCNDADDDCDGEIDEDDAVDALTWYADADGDGVGDAASTTVACTPPTGFVAEPTDCDDSEAMVNPSVPERCNEVDDDCDGEVDEDSAIDAPSWYADADGDGFGDASSGTNACAAPTGTVTDDRDCDDEDAEVNPDAIELCDGVDNDCDGTADEDDAADASTWYADADGDGFGDAAFTTTACTQPSGFVADAADCDDGAASVSPDAGELCDGVDNDCDGDVDEDDAVDATSWYADADADGYGDPSTTTVACTQPSGFVADDTDCDDGAASANPAGTEECDGLDNDCDGDVDEDITTDPPTWYLDSDGDGFGTSDTSVTICTPPSGYVDNDLDWDDDDADLPGTDCTLLVPGDASAIQDAIDVSVDGDVVCVAAGTYRENIDFSYTDVTVRGVQGLDLTVIDGDGAGSVVTFSGWESAAAVLEGFTLTNGYASQGGGVYIASTSSPTVRDLWIVFNEASNSGGGLYNVGEPTLSRLVIDSNLAPNGGGVYASGAVFTMSDSQVIDNEASQSGGGFYVSATLATVERVLVQGNVSTSSSWYGGGFYQRNGSLYVTNSALLGNEANYGAGLAVYSASTVLENVVVAGNQASGRGGGLCVTAGGTLEVTNAVLTANEASYGGAMYLSSGSASFFNSNAWGDSPDEYSGLSDPTGTDGNLSVDPLFLDASAADPEDWDLHLDTSSTLIDAGDSGLLDPDGSVSDIGLYGGPNAELFDLDGDGYPEWWQPGAYDGGGKDADTDCDDRDADVLPGSGC